MSIDDTVKDFETIPLAEQGEGMPVDVAGKKGVVYVLDDDHRVLGAARASLEREGYIVRTFGTNVEQEGHNEPGGAHGVLDAIKDDFENNTYQGLPAVTVLDVNLQDVEVKTRGPRLSSPKRRGGMLSRYRAGKTQPETRSRKKTSTGVTSGTYVLQGLGRLITQGYDVDMYVVGFVVSTNEDVGSQITDISYSPVQGVVRSKSGEVPLTMDGKSSGSTQRISLSEYVDLMVNTTTDAKAFGRFVEPDKDLGVKRLVPYHTQEQAQRVAQQYRSQRK